MKEIKLSNDKTLKVGFASFEAACKLKNTILTELSKVGIDTKKLDLKNVLATEVDNDLIVTVLQGALKLESNSKIDEAFYNCAKHSSIDDEKITKDTFEDPLMWEVYLEVKIAVIKENLLPFFKGLRSSASQILNIAKSALK